MKVCSMTSRIHFFVEPQSFSVHSNIHSLTGDPVLAQLPVEGVAADPQLFSRMCHMPARLLQRIQQRQALGIFQRMLAGRFNGRHDTGRA